MLLVNIYVNKDMIDQVGVVNTGHRNKETGEHLYRINYPEDYQEEFNEYEIWHNRNDPWSVLIEKTLKVINKNPDFITETLKRKEDTKKRLLIDFLVNNLEDL